MKEEVQAPNSVNFTEEFSGASGQLRSPYKFHQAEAASTEMGNAIICGAGHTFCNSILSEGLRLATILSGSISFQVLQATEQLMDGFFAYSFCQACFSLGLKVEELVEPPAAGSLDTNDQIDARRASNQQQAEFADLIAHLQRVKEFFEQEESHVTSFFLESSGATKNLPSDRAVLAVSQLGTVC